MKVGLPPEKPVSKSSLDTDYLTTHLEVIIEHVAPRVFFVVGLV